MSDRILSARPAPMPANVMPRPLYGPVDATDLDCQLSPPVREIPMRLRLDRDRPRFNRYTRYLHARRKIHDDRD